MSKVDVSMQQQMLNEAVVWIGGSRPVIPLVGDTRSEWQTS